MKIIKPGKIYKDEVHFTCSCCGCVYSLKNKELQDETFSAQGFPPDVSFSICPWCDAAVYFCGISLNLE